MKDQTKKHHTFYFLLFVSYFLSNQTNQKVEKIRSLFSFSKIPFCHWEEGIRIRGFHLYNVVAVVEEREQSVNDQATYDLYPHGVAATVWVLRMLASPENIQNKML